MTQGLDHAPIKPEMLAVEAIQKLYNTLNTRFGPRRFSLRASAWKALAAYNSSSDAIYRFITNFWNSEHLPES